MYFIVLYSRTPLVFSTLGTERVALGAQEAADVRALNDVIEVEVARARRAAVEQHVEAGTRIGLVQADACTGLPFENET